MRAEGIVDREDPAYRGQAGYTRASLRFYDQVGFGLSLPRVWRCPVARLADLYDENVAAKHLDIGVATGSLLDRARFPSAEPDLTLMDLNPTCLKTAEKRLHRYRPRTHQANVLEPWGLPKGAFGSVGMVNVLHCVPGSIEEKAVAFDYATEVLSPGGTLFGSTVLVGGVSHTRLSRTVLKLANRHGDLANTEDSLEGLSEALASRFPEHHIEVEGAMGIFVAKVPG